MRDTEGSNEELEFKVGLDNQRYLVEDDDEQDDQRDEVQQYHTYMDAVAQKFITVNRSQSTYDPVHQIQEDDFRDPTEEDSDSDPDEKEDHQEPDSPEGDNLGDEDVESNVQQESEPVAETPDQQEATNEGAIDSPVQAQEPQPRREGLRANRVKPGTYTRREYGYHLTHEEAVSRLGKAASVSIVKEVKQLLERKSWHPIMLEDLTQDERKKVIPSKLFVKVKHKPSGAFDKVKSRLVAGGHRQDKSLYKDKTCSPTVSTCSVFLIATIAHKEGRAVATVDVPGAYLNAKIPESTRVFMRLNKTLSDIAIQLDESYANYQGADGTIVVQLDYALYGLIESALLWYQLLSEKLRSIGFVNNPYDRCVFNRVNQDGSQVTLCVHVDDMLITASSEDQIERTLSDMREVLGDVTVNRGQIQDYVGMTFDFSSREQLKVTMENFVSELLKECKVEGVASTPANNNLFQVDDEAALDSDNKEYFHSTVAQLLYLAKRVRPDLLFSVSYLTTRVQKPTVRDLEKLNRVLKYLNGTRDLALYLSGSNVLNISAYIDASYATHSDYKSHSGVCISLGRGPIYCSSSKQKLNSKSSTEAEMIAVSDGLNHVLWLRNLLENQGYSLPPSVVFQDNMSAISLFKTGKSQSSTRTRHIAIRFYFVKDRIESKEIRVEYINTDNMIADILTKPLQGAKFKNLRLQLMGN